jgi:hypothetical protein
LAATVYATFNMGTAFEWPGFAYGL